MGSKAFVNCTSVKEIYIPDAVSSFSTESLKGRDVTLYLTEKCKCYEAVKSSGLKFITAESVESQKAVLGVKDSVFNGFTFTTNNNYAKNLAGYVNFATFGLTIVGLFGLVMVLIEYLWMRLRKNKQEEAPGVRIFAAIFASEIVITTLNTIVLQKMTFASTWNSYPFIVIWIPRAVEGLIICLIQAYLITLLYTV
jgi:hypothetical protein